MDQKLLDALSNLSFALEEISDALKDRKGKKSDTTSALQSGDFSKTIKEIHVGIKSIKKDTEEILKQQKTIIELSKKKTSDKKTDTFESDPKKEGSIKKGVTSIILIAAGVLAIGLAFKLVGKVDFLSVVGLGIGIYTVSAAFEKIGSLKNLTYKKVFMISSVMPLMGMGIWLASQFLSRVKPMSIGQIITAIGIAGAFYFIAPVITTMMDAMMNPKEITMPGGKKIKTSKFDMGRLKATMVALPILMIAMALGITLSSYVLSGIKPMGLGQIITAIAIAGMFSIAAMGVKGLIHALTEETETKGPGGSKTKKMDMGKLMKVALFLPIVMMAIALGITLSSYILAGIKPIGLGQAITAILIAGMFAVVSWGIAKMLTALKDLDAAKMASAVVMIPLLLPAIALAITISSWVLGLIKPISFSQFLTALLISILFMAFSVTLLILAKADLFGKIKMKDVIMIPLIFVALATAIMLSSWILSVSAEITFGRSLEILAFSVVMCIAIIVVAATAWVVTKIGNIDMYIEAGISIVVLAATIMIASLIISQGNYKKYPDWKWSLSVGLTFVIFGAAAWILMKIGNLDTYVEGSISILVLAVTIMATSLILSVGNYKKYPDWKWTLGVGLALAAFGVGAVLLGTQVMNPLFYGGLGVILVVAVTVVAASHILALGNYKKYPTAKWGLGVGLALGAFGVGAVLLGTQVMNPFFYGGLGMILLVSATVVAASHILAKGNYKKYPTVAWGKGVGLALAGFSLGAVLLGFNVLNPFFGGGLKKIKQVAQTIVDVSHIFTKGNWKQFPDTKWAKGISALFKAMDPVFKTISSYNGLFGSFDDIVDGLLRVANGMVLLSKKFKDSASWKYPPLEWGEGVSKNIMKYVNLSNFVSDKLDFLSFSSIRSLVGEMAMTAKILKRHDKDFSFVMPENFMKILAQNIFKYVSIGKQLEKLMTVEENKSISSGVLGNFEYKSRRMVDTSLINRIVSQMVITASILKKGEKNFKFIMPANYVKNLSTNLIGYAKLSREIEKLMTVEEKKSISFGFLGSFTSTARRAVDSSLVNRVANELITTAVIMSKGAKYMTDVNPNFMKNLAPNILYYAKLSAMLRKEQGVGTFVKNMFFGDPISNVANGMVKLAKAYDRLAKSLRNFGGAIKGMDGEKLKQFRGMTSNIAVLSALDSKMFDNMLTVLESRSSVFAKMLNAQAPAPTGRSNVELKKKEGTGKEKKGKHGDSHAQMDILIEMIAVLISQIGSGSTLDDFLQKKLTEKKGETKKDE
jgi:hypothetical protein